MREKGTIWQMGFPTQKPCTSSAQNRSVLACWHYKNKEDFRRAWMSNGIFLLLVLMPPKKMGSLSDFVA